MDIFAQTDPLTLLAAALIMTFGGFVKGAVGFALPMIGIGGLGSFMPAQDTVAILVFPTVLTNFWQSVRQGLGPAAQTLGQFWKLNLLLALTIGLAAQLVPNIPSAALFIFLGALIISATTPQLAGWRPHAPTAPGPRAALEVATGLIAGICGGLSGVWGPPVLFFLISLDTPKVLQIRAFGLCAAVGSIILVPAHMTSGLLNERTLPLSILMCLPVTLGMILGLRWQDRMDQRLFRRLTLVVLCGAGLNLLRRGLF